MTQQEEIEMLKTRCASLRLQLAINNQFLADLAGTLYDHDLHGEEEEVLTILKMNKLFMD